MKSSLRHLRVMMFAVLPLMMASAMGGLSSSCSKNKQLVTDAVIDRDSMPAMTTLDVTSFISDSGIIRYKIVASEWQMFDRRKPPYWAFEKGLYAEKFDTLHNVEARIKADTAYYYTDTEVWTLIGNVHIESTKGETFDTQLMNWNQKTHRVYSDRHIRIVQPERVIEGKGFDSNDQMTEYVIDSIQGIFYVDESEEDTTQNDNKQDTTWTISPADSSSR